jgi:squalene-hopene/tetraprenyl-beta-curcumene cyclase
MGEGAQREGIITGTGFPKVFYLAYTMYRQYFPLMALTNYVRTIERAA